MKVVDTLLLFLLASIWGASFIFMRYLSPILGPILTTTVRTLAAGLFLTLAFTLARVPLGWKRNWKHYIVLGVLNSALPWLLFAWAALGLPGAVSSIVNAITPLWGAIFAALLLGEPIGARKLGGIGLGVAGVAVIGVFGKGIGPGGGLLLPILACVLATFLYGLFGAYVKRWAKDVAPRAITAGSLLVAGMALLPFAAFAPPRVAVVPPSVWLVALVFSLLCSAVAYLIYYRLIASSGVTFALSVTLLIPVFALAWGLLFLGERITPIALAGAALVLAGTWLITGSKAKAARS